MQIRDIKNEFKYQKHFIVNSLIFHEIFTLLFFVNFV